jgi:hypothetical protein
VPEWLAVLPLRPVTVPLAVVVPLGLLVAEPLPETVLPLGPVAEPLAVLVFPEELTVPEPEALLPRGPVTEPLPEVDPLLFLVVEPVAVVVPPLGPVTEPLSLVPVRVLEMEPCPETVWPRLPVAVPLPETVFPFCDTVPEAVPPCLVEAVCWARAKGVPAIAPNSASAESERKVIIELLRERRWREKNFRV